MGQATAVHAIDATLASAIRRGADALALNKSVLQYLLH
jgi:hypothetical protein